ncbi:MAG: MFS transporter [Candidatus Lokiarchaeota archaeon]|nr:MFS transporter [Candidatus Lokiarchaeota archaeon]
MNNNEISKNIQAEVEEWNSYLTYLVVFLSVISFFYIFIVTYRVFIPNEIANYLLGIQVQDLYYISAIAGIGSLLAIFFKRLSDHPYFGRKKSTIIFAISMYALASINIFIYNLILNTIVLTITNMLTISNTSIIVSEEVPAKYRGRAAGIISASGMSSSLLASFLATQFFIWPEHSWQLFFILITIPGMIIVLIMGFKIKETRRFLLTKDNNTKGKQVNFREVFERKNIRPLILISLIIFLTYWIFMTIKSYFKPYMLELGFSNLDIGIMGMLSYPGSMIGYFSSGYLSDHFGRKGTICFGVSVYFIGTLFFLFSNQFWIMLIGALIVNLTWGIFYTTCELLSTEFFNTKIRATAQGVIFFFGSTSIVLGGLIMAPISKIFGWQNLFFWIGTFSIICVIITVLLLPETKGRVLEEIIITEINGGI